MEYKSRLKEFHENFVRGYDSPIGTFFTLFLNILTVSALNGIELKEIGIAAIGLYILFFYSLIGLILGIPAYLSPNFEEDLRKEFLKQETKEDYYYKSYKNLLVISFNTIILTPIIMMLIFNPSGIFNFGASIISTIDSDLIISASILVIAAQFLEQTYLEKVRMFSQDYPKILLSRNSYIVNAIFVIAFAILSLEIVSQNINIAIKIATGAMLLAMYFVFSAFSDMLYIERLRYLNDQQING